MSQKVNKESLKNRQSYVECPTCGFIRNTTPAKYKDPSWDTRCNRCITEEQLKQQLPIGERFGYWTIKDHEFIRQPNKTLVNVRCDCGTERAIAVWTIVANKSRSCSKCSYVKAFKGYEEISITYYKALESAALRRKHLFDVSIEYIWDLFLQQQRQCAISGCPLILTNSNHLRDQTASLDRIDSKQGYVVGNVQWVHKLVNRMKMDLDEKEFFSIVKQIYEYKKL